MTDKPTPTPPRQRKAEARQRAAEERRRQEEEAKPVVEEERQRRAEAEERSRQEEEAKRVAEEERQRRVEAEERHRQEEEAKRVAEGQIKLRIGDGQNDEVRWLQPGGGRAEWFKDFPVGPEMIVVPAGTFLMGSSDGEGDKDERPQHEMTIARPFAIGRFAVTFDEWAAAYGRGGVKHDPGDQGWGLGRRPVINVSWEDAMAYVGWLSRETRKSYRLLSETEWEYCCRAGTTTTYSFGDTIDNRQSQFSETKTAEVGSYPANAWGLHDMHGNVWEWCEDTWHPNYEGALKDGSEWKGGDASFRVLRGGSWINSPRGLRSAFRFRFSPDGRGISVGFRVARTL